MNQLRTAILDMPDAEYHADPCSMPSLSFSIGWTLLSQSPAHAYLRHPQLGGKRRKSTANMDDGTIAHTLLLGKGAERIIKIDHDDYRKKVAQEERDSAIAAGLTPIIADKHAIHERKAAIISKKLATQHGIVLLPELAEKVLLWVEYASDGTPVQCRAKLDYIDGVNIVDLKSCTSAHPKKIDKSIEEHGYHVQEAAYRSGACAVNPELAGRDTYTRLFFELEEPFCITKNESAGSHRVLGAMLWQLAIDRWAACLRDDRWPEYVVGTYRSEASKWAIAAAVEAGLDMEQAA